MADAAAKREARRRRILENSEYRLQRITGQSNSDNVDDDHHRQHVKSDPRPALSDLNINGILPSESLVNSPWDDPLEIDNQIVEESIELTVLRRRNFTQDNIRNENGNAQGQAQRSFTSGGSNDFLLNSRHTTVKDHQLSKESPSIFISFLANRLAYIFLAALVNLMLIFKLENSFGTSIIVPFLLMLVGRLWICGKSSETQTGSMFMAALILCNVRPHFIYKLRATMNFLSRIVKDLSMFIFSFVLMYYTISRYWIDVDALLPNKVEVIVDRHAST